MSLTPLISTWNLATQQPCMHPHSGKQHPESSIAGRAGLTKLIRRASVLHYACLLHTPTAACVRYRMTCCAPGGYLWVVSVGLSWEVHRPTLEGMFPELQHVSKDLQAVARAAADIMSSLESGVNHLAGLVPPPVPAAAPTHLEPPLPASAPAGAQQAAAAYMITEILFSEPCCLACIKITKQY